MTFLDPAMFPASEMSQRLTEAAVEGMWPWRGETVDIFSDYDIEFGIDRITVEIRSSKWEKYLFYGRVEIPRDVLLDHPTGEFWLGPTCDLLMRSIRNRPIDHIIGDNIILGEY